MTDNQVDVSPSRSMRVMLWIIAVAFLLGTFVMGYLLYDLRGESWSDVAFWRITGGLLCATAFSSSVFLMWQLIRDCIRRHREG